MNDSRPSENTDNPLQLSEMRRRGFFDDLPKLTEGFFTQEELATVEPYETNAPYETADAQHIVAAIDRLTEQQRLANLIAFEAISGEKNRAEIRKGLNL